MCRSIMKRLRIPTSEIANEVVLREKSQVAQVRAETGQVDVEDVQEGKTYALITRQIKKVPVWNSSLVVGFTQDRRIGFMQLHWP
jgi:hypothetical protein